MHLFLSPHLDDVVLSCGATIARLKERGEQVVILTVMAGEPPESPPDTPVLRALQDRLQNVHRAIISRRLEDAQAAFCLGVQIYHLSLLDAMFRAAPSRDGMMPLYPSEDSQYAKVHPADDARVRLLATPLPFAERVTCLYAPLGVGSHVDHQLVRDWGLVLGGSAMAPVLKFYAEYPSGVSRPALERALRYFADDCPALSLRPEVLRVAEREVAMKIKALRCYSYHVNANWTDMEAMERIVRAWMRHDGGGAPAERYWLVIKN